MSQTADDMFERLYVCNDPDCTATHVELADVPSVEFKEQS